MIISIACFQRKVRRALCESLRMYLTDHVLDDKSELSDVRKSLSECFDSLTCFLLPHPGANVRCMHAWTTRATELCLLGERDGGV